MNICTLRLATSTSPRRSRWADEEDGGFDEEGAAAFCTVQLYLVIIALGV